MGIEISLNGVHKFQREGREKKKKKDVKVKVPHPPSGYSYLRISALRERKLFIPQ